MTIDRFIQLLLPKDQKFHGFFERMAKNLMDGAAVMRRMTSVTAAERETLITQLHDIEHQCDNITHDIFAALNSTFVTPFDREDIHVLASALDDVMDFMDEASRRLSLYKIVEMPDAMSKLIDVIHGSTTEIVRGVTLLHDIRKAPDVRKILHQIHAYENEADDIFERTLAQLFDEEKDPIRLIKLKDIYGSLERATDKCEDVANVLESILIKNA